MKDLQVDIKTLIEEQRKIKGVSSPLPESLITKLANLTIRPQERPKEPRGKLLIFKDPLKIHKEEQEKLKR